MIQATDVRLGNWVYATDGSKRQITMESLLYLQAYPTNNQAEGIPLTEEILLKAGFKKWGRDDMPRTLSYELGEMQIFPSNPFCDFEGYGFMHYKPIPSAVGESAKFKFQYLHQLQNLYFALTGEELKITL